MPSPRLRLAILTGAFALCACLTEQPPDDGDDAGGIVIPEDASFLDASDTDGDSSTASPDDGGVMEGSTSEGGQTDAGEPDLCDYPEVPPRIPAVSEFERSCSASEESWPDCIPDACDAADFADACRQYCEMTCERERWFCTRNHCPTPDAGGSYCDTAEAMQECSDLCGNDVGCLQDACAASLEVSCEDIECPEGEAQDCAGLTCTNTCGTAFDGECDDGSPINASFQGCELGSDCADCGARAACFEVGSECFANSQCCGFETGDTWCVNVGTPEAPLGRCVADCTNDMDACDEGTCLELAGSGKACFPFCSVAP